jgi:hypothetical protein
MVARLPRIDRLILSVTWVGVIDCKIPMVGNHIYMMRHAHAFATHL